MSAGLIFAPFERLARHSGTCPWCGRYIAKNRSWIAAFAVPLVPNPRHVRYYADRNVWLIDGAPGRITPKRAWGHADCVAKSGRQYTADELEMLGEDWRDELREMHRAGRAALQRGRRQWP